MDEYDRKENESKEGPVHGHKDKEDELNQAETSALPDTTSDDEKKANAEKAAEDVSDDPKTQDEYIKKVNNPENKYNIVEVSNMRGDGPFFEIVPDLVTKVMHYNMNHEFFLHLYTTLNELRERVTREDRDDENILQHVDMLRGYFDDLFFAYSEAYYDLDDHSRKDTVENTLDELMSKWNFHLRKIYKNL